MKALRRLWARWETYRLERRLRTGKAVYGRQGPVAGGGGGMAVQGTGTFTIAAVVTRASGSVEHLGVIARGVTDGKRPD